MISAFNEVTNNLFNNSIISSILKQSSCLHLDYLYRIQGSLLRSRLYVAVETN